MISRHGDSYQSVVLSKGHIKKTAGVFKGAKSFVCHADGNLKFTYEGGTDETIAWVADETFPVDAVSIEILTGTFSIGFD